LEYIYIERERERERVERDKEEGGLGDVAVKALRY
jgi:hypothetical protein